uniref:Uncharacterized protein n=1 Tax=Sander lucioperca TaxID=283035 RepID=A0A8D0D4F5_SANLU
QTLISIILHGLGPGSGLCSGLRGTRQACLVLSGNDCKLFDALGQDVRLTDMQQKNGTVRFRKRWWEGLQNVRFSDTWDKNGTRTPVSWVKVLSCLTHSPPPTNLLEQILILLSTIVSLNTMSSYSCCYARCVPYRR